MAQRAGSGHFLAMCSRYLVGELARLDPSTNGWSTLPPLTAPRSGHAAGLMADGTLVLFGGQNATATTTTIETLRF